MTTQTPSATEQARELLREYLRAKNEVQDKAVVAKLAELIEAKEALEWLGKTANFEALDEQFAIVKLPRCGSSLLTAINAAKREGK